MGDLRKLILATVAYYDLFDFALTVEEIKKYLVAPNYLKIGDVVSLDGVDADLYSLVNTRQLVLAEGFYTLPKREYLAPLRIRRNNIAKEKIKRARRMAGLMSLMPYVQAVFASGSLALENTDYESDLDLFIIAKAGRIWTARFIINSVFDVLHLKRKPQDKVAPGKICPNHFVTDNTLTIPNQNVFTAHIYSHLVPLYLRDLRTLNNFYRENQWIGLYINTWDFSNRNLVKNYVLVKAIKFIKELPLNTTIGELVEKFCRKYQKKRIEKNPLTHNPHGRIEYNDKQLEFHPHSIEEDVINSYRKSLEKLLIT